MPNGRGACCLLATTIHRGCLLATTIRIAAMVNEDKVYVCNAFLCCVQGIYADQDCIAF